MNVVKSAEEFWTLQHRLEAIELAIAMGQDTPELDCEYEELNGILDTCGWKINMDTHQAEYVGA